ncbi:hypothetical protein CONCODRAFT_77221 [Conidiobolus coronatus NRRL 28638]|uniref:Uncharacterized protein n=1 Tax=Conidiobolus coronatus (strain ATCC 28846 / CBS 209.66 / NRRL 28638) TaxID=796925 RepID=A0A137PFF5_CONC2|nr:hypothetical protein CONCODRAFT_77221 [Conidiobolus coronatus NRRL 28638]|eukprot:KXN73737.1 hypothetical protein CONCODRAFT_77221 [Conidiobolus coronatus NRRL 28638]
MGSASSEHKSKPGSIWPSNTTISSSYHHKTVGVDRPMRSVGKNRVSIYSQYGKINQITMINAFECKVLSIVKTVASYPDPKDPLDVYDPQSIRFQPRLHFRKGGKICVVGKEAGYLIGYRMDDKDRDLGYFSPHLAKVDQEWVAAISPQMSSASHLSDLEPSYEGSIMTLPSPPPFPPPQLPDYPPGIRK